MPFYVEPPQESQHFEHYFRGNTILSFHQNFIIGSRRAPELVHERIKIAKISPGIAYIYENFPSPANGLTYFYLLSM